MGLRIFQSVRLRLAVFLLVTFAIVQSVFGFAFLSIRRTQSSEQFDDCLRGQAKSLAKVVNVAENYDVTYTEGNSVSSIAREFGCAEFYHHIRKPTGEVIDSSSNLAERIMTAELPPLDELKAKREVIETVDGPAVDAVLGEGGRFRLISYWHVTKLGRPVVIQVAMDMASLDRAKEQAVVTFISISVLALLASGIAAWLIADRALKPWKDIKAEVSRMTPGELGQRIEVQDVDAELSDVASTLNNLFERVDRAFKAQNEFLTHAAHELRTPVSVLLGEAQIMLRKTRNTEEYAEYIETMVDEMRRLSRIIEGMLTLARTRAGTRILALDELSANDLVIEAMEDCQSFASQRGVQFAASLALYGDDDVEPNVRGDRRLLVAMLDNILRNAIRVSPIDGRIDVTVEVRDTTLEIAVMDRGPGIPEDKLKEVFVGFKSLHQRGITNGGAGIGLAIARNVVEMHGGLIEAMNRPDGGARFRVTLPLDHGEDATPSDAEAGGVDVSGE